MITRTDLYDATLEDNFGAILCMEDAGWAVRQVVPLPGALLVVYERQP